ncbi:E3 ubiquitin/ISG15 ligase TRIM25-like [Gadus morhua]|uniref:E3 ubiquitin/ISG15 ligase TRIM25-like n=1 Tax=Gadus morhua TaxID=8049 RepID=UPI0011B79C07|nr:E3 ubiquitin/ISG15 ligase TRIM25-like [Gadus morhua]
MEQQPIGGMASATSWSEEDFSCSICLDVFNSPVTTPCGHNFCRTCITVFWDDMVQYKCPVCNELFHTRPVLRVNTFILGMVDQFRSSVRVKEQPCVEPGEVPCDVCTGTQLKAVKSCLVCYTSYCQTHLEPHQRVSRLKTHQLVDPLDSLEDRMCKKHGRLLELFCQTDQVCACVLCTMTDHKSHPVVPLKEEYEVKTAQLGKIEAEVQQMIKERQRKIKDIIDRVDHSKADADREIADGVQVLTALRRSVEKCLDDHNKTVQEKLKSTEKEAEGLIKELQQEIKDLTNRSSEVKQFSQTEDHLHLLQTFRSLKDPPPTRDWTTVEVRPPSYVGTLRRALDQLEETLNMEVKKVPDLRSALHKYACDLTLDPNTAYRLLSLSAAGRCAESMAAFRELSRKHGFKISTTFPCSVEDCSLAVAGVVVHSSIRPTGGRVLSLGLHLCSASFLCLSAQHAFTSSPVMNSEVMGLCVFDVWCQCADEGYDVCGEAARTRTSWRSQDVLEVPGLSFPVRVLFLVPVRVLVQAPLLVLVRVLVPVPVPVRVLFLVPVRVLVQAPLWVLVRVLVPVRVRTWS